MPMASRARLRLCEPCSRAAETPHQPPVLSASTHPMRPHHWNGIGAAPSAPVRSLGIGRCPSGVPGKGGGVPVVEAVGEAARWFETYLS